MTDTRVLNYQEGSRSEAPRHALLLSAFGEKHSVKAVVELEDGDQHIINDFWLTWRDAHDKLSEFSRNSKLTYSSKVVYSYE